MYGEWLKHGLTKYDLNTAVRLPHPPTPWMVEGGRKSEAKYCSWIKKLNTAEL
jgi:hypothetical protein